MGASEQDIERMVGPERYYPEPPALDPENAEYLAAFADLSPLRPAGFGVSAIPASEMLAYCRLHGIADTEEFFGRIRAADAAFLEWHRAREKDKHGH